MAQRLHMQDTTVLEALRVQTKEVHEELHHHSHFVALFEETISLDRYRELVEKFHGFYAPLENAIERALLDQNGQHTGYTYAKRAILLEQDLVDLGLSQASAQQNPQCDQLADIVTPASLGGVLYVIEGSTLGAAQIDRAAQKLLGKNALNGRRFWAWCRAQNKERWALTNTYLEHLQDTNAPREAIIDGARDTFEALADWLAPLDQPALTTESERS